MESSSETNPPNHHGDSSTQLEPDATLRSGAMMQSTHPLVSSDSKSDAADVAIAFASIPIRPSNNNNNNIGPAKFVTLSEATVGPKDTYADLGRLPRGVRYVARENAYSATIDNKFVGYFESEEVRVYEY